MKHNLAVTLILLTLFFVTQMVGLGLIASEMDVVVDEQGVVQVTYQETAIGERPETEGVGSFALLVIGVALGTILLLVLIKLRQVMVWKMWYFAAVTLTITIALGVLLPVWIAGVLGVGLAAWKIFRTNPIIHNFTELLVYAGIALLVSPLLDVFWAAAVLLAFALYDVYAVFKSKHMIAMAQFQTESKLFAGMMIPSPPRTTTARKTTKKHAESKSAILGGGDIALPLIFSGAALHWLVEAGQPIVVAYALTLIISLCATLALAALFVYAKKGRFYPAMPPIAAGCFIGLAIIWLLI